MYSDQDIEAAIRGGALTREAAQSLRAFVARARAAPGGAPGAGPVAALGADEEQFRLLTGFNDIFVSIAIVLSLAALGWLAGGASPFVGGAAVAAASWSLAEYFTRRRRMALPSIVLVIAFTGAVLIAALAAFGSDVSPFALTEGRPTLTLLACVTVTAIAAFAHWRRFAVPITVAIATAAGAGMIVVLLLSGFPSLFDHPIALILVTGLAIFAFAMRWDSQDPARVTRRSDVAFWLHLLASPLIVHPIFNALGMLRADQADTGSAAAAVVLYAALAVVALAVDRRAILVSALVYVLYAMSTLLQGVGSLGTAFAVAALAIGGLLLMLSALWQRARLPVIRALPARLQAALPPVHLR